MTKATTAYKAFNADFTCRDYKFEIGKSYEVAGAIRACANGFHACENPLDVLDYYSLLDSQGKLARFGEVSLTGANDRDGNKIASAQITINAELNLPEFIKRGVDWIINAAKGSSNVETGHSAQLAASGDSAQLAASGHSAKLAASGHSAQLAASGDYAQLAASGDYAQLAASGDSAQLAASGHSAKLAASGHYAQLAASGDYARLAASGDYAQLAASGHSAKLAASGDSGVIAMCGRNNQASGVSGTHIAIAEFNDFGKPIGFAVGEIGKDGLLPDTLYKASGGKLVPA